MHDPFVQDNPVDGVTGLSGHHVLLVAHHQHRRQEEEVVTVQFLVERRNPVKVLNKKKKTVG